MELCLIVASGTSLKNFDFDTIPEHIKIIAINGVIENIPRAEYWFTLDPSPDNRRIMRNSHEYSKTEFHAAVPEDYGDRNARNSTLRAPRETGIIYHNRITGIGPLSCKYGLSETKGEISTGNSAYGALNLAYHLGFTRIGILGVDGGGRRWHNDGETKCCNHIPALFSSAVYQLERNGILVINGSLESTVDCFQKMSPEHALQYILNYEKK